MPSIVELPGLVQQLSEEDKVLFSRLFSVTESIGELKIPKEMEAWVIKNFGSLESVQRQRIIRVDNNISYEGSLFNELRAKRPIAAREDNDIKKTIDDNRGDPLCTPLTGTPEDVFGRVKGTQSISCSNIAKYDGYHGLVVFKEHNPLLFGEKQINDYLEVAKKWLTEANKKSPECLYPFVMWNCLWKSGASLIHGHMQMTLGRGRHYLGAQKIKKVIDDYREKYQSDYYEDLLRIHDRLGLAILKEKTFCSLTPFKEKETIIVEKDIGKSTAKKINRVLQAYLKLGVQSFNMGILIPPLDKSWKDFPVIIRLVDRGELNTKTVDIAAMEMFAGNSVISSDPYRVIEEIRKQK